MIKLFLHSRLSLSDKQGKVYSTMSTVIMGNGFNTVVWVKLKVFQCGARIQHRHTYSFFLVPCCWITFNLNLRKAKLSLPIMPIGIVAYAFTLSWDNLLSKQLYIRHLELCQKCSVMRCIFNSILTVWKMWSNTVFCVWYNYNYLKHIHL